MCLFRMKIIIRVKNMKRRRLLILIVVALMALTLFPAAAMAEPGDVLNFKIYLIDKDSYALPDYIVTVDNNVQGIANEHGVLSIDGVSIEDVDTFKLFSKNKEQLGAFNMSYFNAPGTATNVSDEGGSYILNYSMPSSTVYMYMLYDKNSDNPFHPVDASDNPLEPGKKREEPKPTATPSAKPSAKPSASASPTAKPAPDSPNPQVAGYVVDENMNPLVHAGVILVNDEKGGSLSVTTDEEGWYTLPGITTGQHSLYISPEKSDVEDSVDFNVITGNEPNIVQKGDDDLELVISNAGGTVYANFMASQGDIDILAVSGAPLNPPAPAPTAAPTVVPTTEPTVAPTAAPTASSEPTAVISVDPTSTPAPSSSGMPQDMVFIIIAIIAAVAAIIIAIIIVKSKGRK